MTASDLEMNAPADHQKVRVWKALLLYFGLLIAAMVAAWPDPVGFLAIALFPLGLIELFPGGKHASSCLWLILAYGSYAVFLYLFIAYRRRPVFYFVVIAYAVVLMLNVVSCRQMVADWKASQP